MNRVILVALAVAFATNALSVPLVPNFNYLKSAYNPHEVCNAIQALEHDICNHDTANNSLELLCDAMSDLNATLCADAVSNKTFRSFTEIPIQKICPLLEFVDTELCSNDTIAVGVSHTDTYTDTDTALILAHPRPVNVHPADACPIIKLFDEELCGQSQPRY
jgi:hypothetical protein